MNEFRQVLALRDTDLDGDSRAIALAAQAWASTSKAGRQITAATFNLRLSIISSFYTYLIRQGIWTGTNPISRVERRKVQAYARAMPLDAKDLRQRLKSIDRTTLLGKRDYALLTVLTATGRRLLEVASLSRSNLTFEGEVIRLDFERCKGGKRMSDRLTAKQSQALLKWLHGYYGSDLDTLTDNTPVWVSLSHQNHGAPLGAQAIADVCQKYLGTSKVHTLRHTFAVAMEQAGASISEIQHRLGHESAATTSMYLDRLHAAENPYADELDDLFGIGE